MKSMSSKKSVGLLTRDGFTLIEILIVVSITAILSSLVITYSKTSERQVTLYVEAQKISSLIFRAKSFSISTYSDSSQNRCGYGVAIDYAAKTYSLFAYQEPSTPNCPSISSTPPNFRVNISTYNLNPGLVLKNTNSDSLSVVLFVPPNPNTLLSVNGGASLVTSPAKIYMETGDGLAKRSITVNSSGQVDF